MLARQHRLTRWSRAALPKMMAFSRFCKNKEHRESHSLSLSLVSTVSTRSLETISLGSVVEKACETARTRSRALEIVLSSRDPSIRPVSHNSIRFFNYCPLDAGARPTLATRRAASGHVGIPLDFFLPSNASWRTRDLGTASKVPIGRDTFAAETDAGFSRRSVRERERERDLCL